MSATNHFTLPSFRLLAIDEMRASKRNGLPAHP